MVKRYLMMVLSLMSLLALTSASLVSTPIHAAAPPHSLGQSDVETFQVAWDISVNYYKDDSSADSVYWERQKTTIVGKATVRVPHDGGPSRALPFVLTVTDDTEHLISDPCATYRYTRQLLDPEHYNGGPDPFWVNPVIWLTTHPWDKEWYMTNPLQTPYWDLWEDDRRFFTYHIVNQLQNNCNPEASYSEERTFQGEPLSMPLYPYPGGNNVFNSLWSKDGVTFALDLTYDADPWTHVRYHVSVVRPCGSAAALSRTVGQGQASNVCGCAAIPEGQVIDAGNPIVRRLEVNRVEEKGSELEPLFNIGPNGRQPLTYTVACEGRPISNAELKISVEPKQPSGSHKHHDARRPRGYLNGAEITHANPSIKITTGADGKATVQFEPGRDLVDGLYGISGIYEVKAQSTRFPSAQTQDVVRVGVYNLELVTPGPNYMIAPSKSHKGDSTLYGTAATLNAVKQLANDFQALQEVHNKVMTTTWPIAKVIVGDMSLKSGGLLDLKNSWESPYRGHDYGWDVRLNYKIPPLLKSRAGERGLAWLKHIFEMEGTKYGQWHTTSGKLNLRVDQSASASVAAAQSTGGPDLTTMAFLSDPEDRYAAGAGQTVTYTVGVENLAADVPAHGVILTATLPAGLGLVRTIPSPTRLVGGRPVWELGTLVAEGIPQVFDIAGQIGAGVAPGTVLTVTAEAGLSEADANPADNQAESFGLQVQPSGADLVIYSEIAASAMIPGQLVTFTVGAGNAGNVSTAASALTLTLPASVTLVGATPTPYSVGPDRAVWQLGDIAPDASAEVTVTVYLSPALGAAVSLAPDEEESGVLTYTLQVSTDTLDFDLSNNIQDVVMPLEFAGPDLLAKLGVKIPSGASALTPGQDITYTVFYGNYGNQVAPTTTITLSLWSGMSLVSAEPAPSRTITSSTFLGGVLGWDMGDLPVGNQGEIRVRVHVAQIPSEGSMVLAVVSSNEIDIQPTDNIDVRIESSKRYAVYLPLVIASAHGGPAPTATATPTPTATAETPLPPPPGLGPRRFPAVTTATPVAP
jgi:uncharacterized repeat protein (TIGR01451 family)